MIYYINNNIYAISKSEVDTFNQDAEHIRASNRPQVEVTSLAEIREVEESMVKSVLVFEDTSLLSSLVYSYVCKIGDDLSVPADVINKVLSIIGVDTGQQVQETFDYSLVDASCVSYEFLITVVSETENAAADLLLRDKLVNAISSIERESLFEQVVGNRKQLLFLMEQIPEVKKVLGPYINNPDKLSYRTLERILLKHKDFIMENSRLTAFLNPFITAELLSTLRNKEPYKHLLPSVLNGYCNYFSKRAFRLNHTSL